MEAKLPDIVLQRLVNGALQNLVTVHKTQIPASVKLMIVTEKIPGSFLLDKKTQLFAELRAGKCRVLSCNYDLPYS